MLLNVLTVISVYEYLGALMYLFLGIPFLIVFLQVPFNYQIRNDYRSKKFVRKSVTGRSIKLLFLTSLRYEELFPYSFIVSLLLATSVNRLARSITQM